MKKFAAWFDIPVSDMARAIAFYEHLTSQNSSVCLLVKIEKQLLRREEQASIWRVKALLR